MIEPGWHPPAEFEEYRLVRLLGRGTMGEVYLARDALLDRPVAVKFVQAAGDPLARARFFDEARAIARLQHPNVVAIYRVAEVAGHPYLVSEYVRGQPLDQLERPVPWRQVLDLALDLARGLAAAHRCGVLHRDVKPANAILAEDGRAKLLDFGLARITEGAAPDAFIAAPPHERGEPAPRITGGLPPSIRWSLGDTVTYTAGSTAAVGSPVRSPERDRAQPGTAGDIGSSDRPGERSGAVGDIGPDRAAGDAAGGSAAVPSSASSSDRQGEQPGADDDIGSNNAARGNAAGPPPASSFGREADPPGSGVGGLSRDRGGAFAGSFSGSTVDGPAGSFSGSTVDCVVGSLRGSPGPEHPVGTPLYMAPELWRCEPATRRSDLYSLGILLYELATGAVPLRAVSRALLGEVVEIADAMVCRVAEIAPEVEPALAAIIDRLVEPEPSARFASADALVAALEDCAAPPAAPGVPDGNPYRGLAAFDSAHAALFFGRRGEIRELVQRVQSEPLVVIGGDSGTGKSSLCRAGVLPWLVEHDGWSRVDVVPGRHPVQSLAAALAAWSEVDEATLTTLVREAPDALARAIRRRVSRADHPGRLLLFVDQLEELLTLAEPDEARAVAAALAALAVHGPSVRVLATVRSDFLSRLAMLPGLGEEIARGLYFLRPLTGERIREAILRPAAAKGVAFESDAVVDALVAQTELAPGGLPLLQFTLAEVWDARDPGDRTIRAASLAALGGVEGALTRHADRLIAGLTAEEQEAARRLLLGLVTADGTRARRSEAELLSFGAGHRAERAALEVLVRGRIVVANDAQHGAYEIAHEALLVSWPTLQGWLQRGAAERAVRVRVEQVAAEWERMSRPRDLLWGRSRLAEVRALDGQTLARREVAFLAASRAAVARRRAVALTGTAVLVIGAVAIGLAVRARARRELEAVIANQVRSASAAVADAGQLAARCDAARTRAFGLFDAHRWSEGEEVWNEVEDLATREAGQYRTASSRLEDALSLDPARPALRTQFADLTFERLLRAERERARQRDLADELAARLVAYDDGRHRAALDAAATIELEVVPAGARISIERVGDRAGDRPGERPGPELLGTAPLPPLHARPGSLILAVEHPGRLPVRLPVLLARGETVRQRIVLPVAGAAPHDMIYVPPGRFLFGSADATDLRRGFLTAAPVHEVATAGYYIGRNEVTFGEWIEFLDELSPEERHRRAPSAVNPRSSLTLTEVGPKHWRLALTPTTHTYTAETGQRLRYEHRTRRAEQDWTRFPVAAVSYDDAVAYAAWLARTGRVPGARLCDEYEWERAARGADARTFPGGDALAPDDANIDITYGRDPLAFGPDEIGSHPASRSPVGADDMAGNVWEWTRSVEAPGTPVARGGGWYNAELSSRSANRESGEPSERHLHIGVRLCATPRGEEEQ
jgi:serine/threonine protein kinase/formylglycine-generating enzyme required for sulfatase activity